MLAIAYGLEDGLATVYRMLAKGSSPLPMLELFNHLADFEEKHKQKLFELYLQVTGAAVDLDEFINHTVNQTAEGGKSLEELLKLAQEQMKTPGRTFDLALSLETQALDLYLRFFQKLTSAAARSLVAQIAQDEKFHMAKLEELSNQSL